MRLKFSSKGVSWEAGLLRLMKNGFESIKNGSFVL